MAEDSDRSVAQAAQVIHHLLRMADTGLIIRRDEPTGDGGTAWGVMLNGRPASSRALRGLDGLVEAGRIGWWPQVDEVGNTTAQVGDDVSVEDGLLTPAGAALLDRWDEELFFGEGRFVCPRCCRASSHPVDLAEGYCGACRDYTAAPTPPTVEGDTQ